jgi:hypothetical protein
MGWSLVEGDSLAGGFSWFECGVFGKSANHELNIYSNSRLCSIQYPHLGREFSLASWMFPFFE